MCFPNIVFVLCWWWNQIRTLILHTLKYGGYETQCSTTNCFSHPGKIFEADSNHTQFLLRPTWNWWNHGLQATSVAAEAATRNGCHLLGLAWGQESEGWTALKAIASLSNAVSSWQQLASWKVVKSLFPSCFDTELPWVMISLIYAVSEAMISQRFIWILKPFCRKDRTVLTLNMIWNWWFICFTGWCMKQLQKHMFWKRSDIITSIWTASPLHVYHQLPSTSKVWEGPC